MKTLIAAVAFATVLAAPAFAQTQNSWGWKGSPYAARASTKSAYAASFNGPRRVIREGRTHARNYKGYPLSAWYTTDSW